MAKMKFTGGLPETPCGAGSTLQHTATIRLWLPRLFRELKVETILDAPCGDFNWMSHTDLRGLTYIGIDVDPEHCKRAKETNSIKDCKPDRKIIVEHDIVEKVPSCADLMLCRDFWQHLRLERVHKAVESYIDSDIKWLLCTNFQAAKNEDIAADGMFRPLNVTLPPINFPPPRKMISDGHARTLALWHRNDLTHRPVKSLPVHPSRIIEVQK